MDKQTERVFTGFVRLTNTQKNDLIQEMNIYLEGNTIVKEMTEKRLYLGPLATNACPCCNR